MNAIRHADGARRRLHLVFLTLLLAVGAFTPSPVRAQEKSPTLSGMKAVLLATGRQE